MKTKIKYLLIGAMIATIISFSTSAFADQLISLLIVDYKIMVNNAELKNDLPVLNYNGNTYIPLRKVSEATGANVEWDSINRRVNITSSVYGVNTSIEPQTIIKEVIKEVPATVKGHYGNITAELKNNIYTLFDRDANGTGIAISTDLKNGYIGSYVNGKLSGEYFLKSDEIMNGTAAPTTNTNTNTQPVQLTQQSSADKLTFGTYNMDTSNPYVYKVTGTVKNSDSKVHRFKVKAYLYDANKNIIGTQEDYDRTVQGNDIQSFSFLVTDNLSSIASFELKLTQY